MMRGAPPICGTIHSSLFSNTLPSFFVWNLKVAAGLVKNSKILGQNMIQFTFCSETQVVPTQSAHD